MAKRMKGRDKMRRVLLMLPKTERAGLKAAVHDGAQMIVATQKHLAPRKTGALAESIHATPGTENPPAYASLRGIAANAKDPELAQVITAGNDKVRTAHLVEFGTAPHVVGGLYAGAMHPGTKAEPFFFPGWRAEKRRVLRMINAAARAAIKSGLRA